MRKQTMESDQNRPMSKARDLINAHLCPDLATFAVINGAIQIAPIANQAKHHNSFVEGLITSFEKKEVNTPTITLGTDISDQKQSAKVIQMYLYKYLNYIQQNQNLDG